MGYTYRIKLKDNILLQDIQKIIDTFPNKFLFKEFEKPVFKYGKWTTKSDIYLIDENTISISGSWSISGDTVEELVNYFSSRLIENGCIIKKIEFSY